MLKLVRLYKVKASSLLQKIKTKSRIRVGDVVKVISGDAKNKISKVIRIFNNNRVLLDNYYVVRNIRGNDKIVYLKVHISNLMHYDSENKVASKVSSFKNDMGKKYFIYKKTNNKVINNLRLGHKTKIKNK